MMFNLYNPQAPQTINKWFKIVVFSLSDQQAITTKSSNSIKNHYEVYERNDNHQ